MKLYKHHCPKPNIGDEFNDWFWIEVFGQEITSILPNDLLVGIGTILNDKLPAAENYHIMGSGTGYGDPLDVSQNNVITHFVRGPLTAKKLGLPIDKAITDPAILIAELRPQTKTHSIPVSVMTHVGIDSDAYRELVESMGWHYISPSDTEQKILSDIANTEVLITSAMHGAIMADSYRVKWIPLITSTEILHFKWEDWCQSMQITFMPHQVPAYWPSNSGLIARVKKAMKKRYIQSKLKKIYQQATPSLSEQDLFNTRFSQVKDKFNAIKASLLEGQHAK